MLLHQLYDLEGTLKNNFGIIIGHLQIVNKSALGGENKNDPQAGSC